MKIESHANEKNKDKTEKKVKNKRQKLLQRIMYFVDQFVWVHALFCKLLPKEWKWQRKIRRKKPTNSLHERRKEWKIKNLLAELYNVK